MRKYLWIGATAVLAVLVFAQVGAGQALAKYASTLASAKSLKASYTVQEVNGVPMPIELRFAKPNMVRIDTPSELIVGDGTTLVRYDKYAKTYFKEPQNAAHLKEILASDNLGVFAPFFEANAFTKATAKSLGTVNRKGVKLTAIEAQFDEGKRTMTFYLSDDSLVRQAELAYADRGPGDRKLVNTKVVEIGEGDKPETFTFLAPEGSRELTAEEMLSDKWYDDLEEAKKVAARTKRLIFIDFYADW